MRVKSSKNKITGYAFLLLLTASGLWAQGGEIRESEAEFEWYKTQFGTGPGNCGPAVAAMAIYWSTGKDVSIEQVREEIGEPNNSRAVSLDHLKWALDKNGVSSMFREVESILDLRKIIDGDRIAILWIHTGWLTEEKGDTTATRIGRYYEDECGHFVVLKGYTMDDRYFVTHDPIPGDWLTNTIRYPDGSMLGKDRYYDVSELWQSLKVIRVIDVSRREE